MSQKSNQNVISELEELGLSHHEAAIYLAVLKLGETPAGAIITEVSLHREQVYRALKRLTKEGFLSEFEKNNISYFTAIDPSVFINRSKTQLALAESLLPYLISIKQSKQQIIQISEGEEALKKQLGDMINSIEENGEYLILGGVGNLFYDAARKYLPLFTPLFKEKNIRGRIIAYKGYEYPSNSSLGENISVKTLDRPFGIPASVGIYGNKVAIDLLDPDNIAIITIENEKVANSFRQTFEALWR